MHPDGPWADLRKALFGCLVVNNADNKRWFEDFFAKLRQQPADNATACPFPAKPRANGGLGKKHLKKAEGHSGMWLAGKATPGSSTRAPRCANKFSDACKRVRVLAFPSLQLVDAGSCCG